MKGTLAFAVVVMLCASASAQAATTGSNMKACGAAWSAMSAAGKAKTTYKAFSTTCLKNGPPPVVTAPANTMAASTGNSMKACATGWNAMSAADKAKTNYKAYSTTCLKKSSGPTVQAATSTPAATSKPATTSAPATTAKMSPQDKVKSCASKWNTLKASGKTNGQTYKQFNATCLKSG